MNSRTRILNAIQRKPVDHVPLWMRFWPLGGVDQLPFNWQDPLKRAEYLLALGVDDVLMLEPPLGYVENYDPTPLPGVSTSIHIVQGADPGAARLEKRYETPAGSLRQVVRLDSGWPHGAGMRLFDDHNIPGYVEPLIKSADDLPALRFLLGHAPEKSLDLFNEEAARLRAAAARMGAALEGGMTALGDSAVWLAGMEPVMTGQLETPGLIEALLETLLEWELGRIDLLAGAGVDFITHMAWYEGSDFWTPRCFRRLLKPRLKQLAERAHAHGLPLRYIITRGWKPVQEDLLEIGVDCISGIDPVQDQVDLLQVKTQLGGRACLMGGINSAVSLAQWTDEEICCGVEKAMQSLAPGGGFILYPVDAIFSNQPWEKVLLLIEKWKSLQNI